MEKMLLRRGSKSCVLADEHDVDAEYVDQLEFLPKASELFVCWKKNNLLNKTIKYNLWML